MSDPKKIRVQIVETENLKEFEKLCTQAIAAGSYPNGGLSISVYTNPVTGNPATVYAQMFFALANE